MKYTFEIKHKLSLFLRSDLFQYVKSEKYVCILNLHSSIAFQGHLITSKNCKLYMLKKCFARTTGFQGDQLKSVHDVFKIVFTKLIKFLENYKMKVSAQKLYFLISNKREDNSNFIWILVCNILKLKWLAWLLRLYLRISQGRKRTLPQVFLERDMHFYNN